MNITYHAIKKLKTFSAVLLHGFMNFLLYNVGLYHKTLIQEPQF